MSFAVIDPEEAFEVLKTAALDDGLTRTWALFWAATREDARMPHAFVPECTLAGLDPYLYGTFVACCEGSRLCLGHWGESLSHHQYLCITGDDCSSGPGYK
jgi:hypothetical protein